MATALGCLLALFVGIAVSCIGIVVSDALKNREDDK